MSIANIPVSILLRDLDIIENGIRAGHRQETIRKDMKCEKVLFEELFDIAKARVKNSKTEQSLIYSQHDLRFGTPTSIARYRAKKLACDTIVELCCGVGLQAIEFAKTCKKVIAFELDEKKIEYAKINAILADVHNVEFIQGNVMSERVINRVKQVQPDAIFCDPQRPPQEDQRLFSSILPSIPKLVKHYGPICAQMAIELPPQMDAAQIELSGEKEYISVNGRVNRLTIYEGKLKKHNTSVVVLPGEEVLASSKVHTLMSERNPLSYLLEVDPTVVRANMLPVLLTELQEKDPQVGLCFEEGERCLLTSQKKIQHSHVRNQFNILTTAPNDPGIIVGELNELGATDVLLRMRVDPKKYWDMRTFYTKNLTQKQPIKVIHLFLNKDIAFLCEKI